MIVDIFNLFFSFSSNDSSRTAVHPAAAPALGAPVGERRRERDPAEADGRLQEALAGPQKQNPLNAVQFPAAVDRLDKLT